MDFNEQIENNISHCLLYGSRFGVIEMSYFIQCGWLPHRVLLQKLTEDNMSRVNMQGQGYQIQRNEVLEGFERTDECFLGIITGNASLNCLMTWDLESKFDPPGIKRPVLGNYIPCMVHINQLALGAFIGSLG